MDALLKRGLRIPGKGRVFECLLYSIAKPHFGHQCAHQVERISLRMQEDYRLHYGIAAECEEDVTSLCLDVKVR